MAILDQYQFQVASDLTQLDHVLAECAHINRFDRIPPHDWMQCQMAIAEGFTNAVRHAHGEKLKDCPIDIDLTLQDQYLDIRIWDHSPQGFDLDKHLAALDLLHVNEYATGGRGFIILRKVASKLAYTYVPERKQHYLLISKRLKNRLYPYFISAKKLGDRLGDKNLVVVDCRFRLNDPDWGERAYREGHIPGAYYLHLDRDLSSPIQEHGGRHPLPNLENFTKVLSRLGIQRDTTEVVIYDDFRFAFAARFWWLLKYCGHETVSFLNGGFGAWEAAGYPLQTESPPPVTDSSFQPQTQADLVIKREQLKDYQDRGWVLLDCRDEARYRGEQEPIDPVAGHIPGALNSPWTAVSHESGFAKSFEKQQALWQNYDPEQEIILYCGSGVTACVNWLSLEITGHQNLKLYAGGWSDWCSHLRKDKE